MGKSKETIRGMFASISSRYDLLNHILSLGFDRLWRKKTAKLILSANPTKVLDVCAGTLDLSMAIASQSGFKGTVIGADFCKEMLVLGKKKIEKERQEPEVRSQESEKSTPNPKLLTLNSNLVPVCTDTLYLPFKDNSFDVITSAFGIRNIEALKDALSEMRRVIKDKGRAVILEFYKPKSTFLFSLYLFYFRKILPLAGRIISRDKNAYYYLQDSVVSFLSQEEMKREMELAGFRKVSYKDLTFGVTTIHIGTK